MSDNNGAPTIGTSQYDAGSANDLYNFYDSRTQGENLGYSPSDLNTMYAQTTDQTTHNINESERLGEAGMLQTGGVTTGGMNTMKQNAVNTGLAYRSSALNDVAIQNATLKQQQQYEAAQGLQGFLNNERSNQFQIWQSQYYPWQTNQMTNMYESMAAQQTQQADSAAWGKAASGAASVAVATAPYWAPALAACWVAAEVFDGWDDERTHLARYYVLNLAPKKFREWYIKCGEKFAAYIHDKPWLKNSIRPMFERFVAIAQAQLGRA
jgi:hypothetical protein